MDISRVAMSAVHDFKKRLVERWPGRILEVRIFGSVARGEAREDSDLDVFVLVDDDDENIVKHIVDTAYDVSDEHDLTWWLSPFIKSRSRFEELQRRERLIATEILREGVLV